MSARNTGGGGTRFLGILTGVPDITNPFRALSGAACLCLVSARSMSCAAHMHTQDFPSMQLELFEVFF